MKKKITMDSLANFSPWLQKLPHHFSWWLLPLSLFSPNIYCRTEGIKVWLNPPKNSQELHFVFELLHVISYLFGVPQVHILAHPFNVIIIAT